MDKTALGLRAGLTVLVLAAAVSLGRIHFDNDISVMLPRDPDIRRSFDFFQNAPLARTVAVTFERTEGSGETGLTEAVDLFTARLGPPFVSRVFKGVNPAAALEDTREFLALAPQLAGPEQIARLEAKMRPAVVQEKLKQFYRVLVVSPGSSLMVPVLQQDPLGFHEEALQRLKEMMLQSDWHVRTENGYLESVDGRQALVVLETPVPVTDGFGAKKLIAYLNDALKNLPPGISATLLAGHRHTLSNEQVLKRDIRITSILILAVFLVLFLKLFRDPQALLLFAVPPVSVLLSVHLCSWVLGKFSLIILGMGAVISGIAVDYCLHVYVALRSAQPGAFAVREVRKPVLMGALTTAGAYSVFLFSKVPGFQQLALFTAVSTLLSLGFALLVLPRLLNSGVARAPDKTRVPRGLSASWDFPVLGLWTAVMVGCAMLLPAVHFRSDVKQYDGSSRQIFEQEKKFEEVWGGKSRPAILVVEAPSFDQALERTHAAETGVREILGSAPVSFLTGLWPPREIRSENLKRWNAYWQAGRAGALRETMAAQSAFMGFSPQAFKPFFDTLQPGDETVDAFGQTALLQDIKRRFSFEKDAKTSVISFFPDEESFVEPLSTKARELPGAFVVSPQRFAKLLSDSALSESRGLALAIAVMLPALAFIFLRNVRLTLIALVPAASSVLIVLGLNTLFKLPLNASSLVAVLAVGGYAIDYGLFMLYHERYGIKTDTFLGIALSALTSFFAAGALLFAQHPVLFSFGSSMVFGVLGGYLSAVYVVPAFYRLGFGAGRPVGKS